MALRKTMKKPAKKEEEVSTVTDDGDVTPEMEEQKPQFWFPGFSGILQQKSNPQSVKENLQQAQKIYRRLKCLDEELESHLRLCAHFAAKSKTIA